MMGKHAGRPHRLAGVLVVGLVTWVALPRHGESEPSAAAPPLYELSFELSAEVRTRRFDADLEASARLEMASVRLPDGGLELTLVRPLEPATKFYWIDPRGPFGEESKLAAVVTLEEGSWEALESARAEVARRGVEAHARWCRREGSDRAFDGAFAFVVIGPSAGRFHLVVDDDGAPRDAGNGLTEGWLSGPFHDYVGRWGPDIDPSSAPRGYWFWNDGEAAPFDFEPHVYHTFISALELLRAPRPEVGGSVAWPELARRITDILVRLAPKAERGVAPTERPVTLVGRATRGGDSAATVGTDYPRVARHRSLRDGAVTADRIRVEWREPGLAVRVTVGYRPVTPTTGEVR